MADPDSVVLAGTETIDGERLDRLEIQPAPDITAEMLGFTDPALSEFEATLAFLAEDDGKPATPSSSKRPGCRVPTPSRARWTCGSVSTRALAMWM